MLWWLALTGALTYFLLVRLPDLLSGKAAAHQICSLGPSPTDSLIDLKVWRRLCRHIPIWSGSLRHIQSVLTAHLKSSILRLKDCLKNPFARVLPGH